MNEEKKVPFKWEYGEETISLQLGMYANNQRLYIGMITHTEDGAEPFADMTVNLPGYSLDPGEAFISGDISKDLLRFIKENKLGKVLPYQVQSGYGKYSAVAFDLEKLKAFDPKLFDDGVNLVFINEPYINTDVYKATRDALVPMTNTDVDLILAGVNQYLMKLAEKQVELAFEQAQKERDDLSERTKQGLQTAKLNGKQLGRAKGTVVVTKKSDESKKKILKYSKTFGGDLSDKDLIKLLEIDKNTYYKYKKELKSQIAG